MRRLRSSCYCRLLFASSCGDWSFPGNTKHVRRRDDSRAVAVGQTVCSRRKFGSDIYYDPAQEPVVISQQAGMQKVGEIAKYFADRRDTSKDAAGVMSVAAFPLPLAYTEKASKDLAKGTKPPKMWDVKEGDGNPALVLRLAIV